jgi:hypothetical protein
VRNSFLVSDIIQQELVSIKEALNEAHLDYKRRTGENIKMPLVTLVVAQSYHGIQIVPFRRFNNNNNVPSGTCVDLGTLGIDSLNINAINNETRNNLLPTQSDYIPFIGATVEQSLFDFQLIPHNK